MKEKLQGIISTQRTPNQKQITQKLKGKSEQRERETNNGELQIWEVFTEPKKGKTEKLTENMIAQHEI
jgi:hypothetical protein